MFASDIAVALIEGNPIDLAAATGRAGQARPAPGQPERAHRPGAGAELVGRAREARDLTGLPVRPLGLDEPVRDLGQGSVVPDER